MRILSLRREEPSRKATDSSDPQSSSRGLDRLHFPGLFSWHPVNEASNDRPRYVEGGAWHYQIDTNKPLSKFIGATGLALNGIWSSSRLNSSMALSRGQTAAARRIKKYRKNDWGFDSIGGFLAWFSHVVFLMWFFPQSVAPRARRTRSYLSNPM